jgi:hypothetical protein
VEQWRQDQFKVLNDGSVYVRVGTQTNCAGIAGVHARIIPTETGALTFAASRDPEWLGGAYGPAVPGAEIPEEYRVATFEGAGEAYRASGVLAGLHFELIDAAAHEVDANERRFREAGWVAMTGWLERNTQFELGITKEIPLC